MQRESHNELLSLQDLLGAAVYTDDYVLSGTCDENMYGACESFFKPDMVSRLIDWSTRSGSLCKMNRVLTDNPCYRTQTSYLKLWHSLCLQQQIGTALVVGAV